MHVKQLVGAALQGSGQQLSHNGVALRALDKRRPVRLIQALRPLMLGRQQSVGLARAANAPGLAGHDFYQVIIGGARLDLCQQLFHMYQAMHHGDAENPVANRQGYLPNRLAAAKPGELNSLETRPPAP